VKIQGEQKLSAPRQKVWDALLDPEVLAATLPGCEALEPVGRDEYKMKMKLAMAGVQGLFDGSVKLTDQRPPDSYNLEVKGSGKIGFVNGVGRFDLAEDGDATLVRYSGDVKVGGMIAAVGQRLMDMTAKMMIGRFFSSLSEVLENREGTS
jgi:carbon monoxide dehydrogenase subunit G